MKASLLVCLLAACGRFGFEGVPTRGDGALGADSSTDSGSDAAPLLVPIGTTAQDSVIDIAFDAAGGFAITGEFTQTLTIGGMSAATTASLCFDIYTAAFDPTGAPRWLWSGASNVAGSGQNLAWLPDGRLYTVGYFGGQLANAGNIDAGGGQDALELWLTPSGALDNVAHQGGSANVQVRGLSIAGTLLAFGGIYSNTVDFGQGSLPVASGVDNAFLVSGDVAAGSIASISYNGADDVYINDVAIDASGRICIGGRFNATTDFGGGAFPPGGGNSGFVARFDPGFKYAWAREIDTAIVQSVGFTTNGDCVAGGVANGNFTIDGLTETNPGAGLNDGFVIRFASADGHAEWLQTISGAGDDAVLSLVPYDQDRVAVAGYFAGSAMVAGAPMVSDGANDGFVIGLAEDGSTLWTQLLAGSGSIPQSLSGMDVDLVRRKVGLAATFSGDLQVGSASQTTASTAGLALVLPLP